MKIAQVEGAALREAFRRAGFSAEELDKVLPSIDSFPARYLKAGETLLREGDPTGNATFIQRGRPDIWKRPRSRRPRSAAVEGPGHLGRRPARRRAAQAG